MKDLGAPDLGIRARKKVFRDFRIFLDEKKFWMAAITELPMISQNEVKNAPVKPSGPGLLCRFRAKTASFISSEGVVKEVMKGKPRVKPRSLLPV